MILDFVTSSIFNKDHGNLLQLTNNLINGLRNYGCQLEESHEGTTFLLRFSKPSQLSLIVITSCSRPHSPIISNFGHLIPENAISL